VSSVGSQIQLSPFSRELARVGAKPIQMHSESTKPKAHASYDNWIVIPPIPVHKRRYKTSGRRFIQIVPHFNAGKRPPSEANVHTSRRHQSRDAARADLRGCRLTDLKIVARSVDYRNSGTKGQPRRDVPSYGRESNSNARRENRRQPLCVNTSIAALSEDIRVRSVRPRRTARQMAIRISEP
jgi:hypothetical protein